PVARFSGRRVGGGPARERACGGFLWGSANRFIKRALYDQRGGSPMHLFDGLMIDANTDDLDWAPTRLISSARWPGGS
ncbi:MAG: hypothetical protein K0R61_2084, partial [Microvirga sp.]|nr:hypothetical protein [Microvirga sp.]